MYLLVRAFGFAVCFRPACLPVVINHVEVVLANVQVHVFAVLFLFDQLENDCIVRDPYCQFGLPLHCNFVPRVDLSFHVTCLRDKADLVWLGAIVDCAVVLVPYGDWVVFVESLVDLSFKGVFCPFFFPVYDGNWGSLVLAVHVPAIAIRVLCQ